MDVRAVTRVKIVEGGVCFVYFWSQKLYDTLTLSYFMEHFVHIVDT